MWFFVGACWLLACIIFFGSWFNSLEKQLKRIAKALEEKNKKDD